MTYKESQEALCRKLGIDHDDIANNGLFTLTDIKEAILTGIRKAWDFKDWDFKHGDKKTDVADQDYYDYPDEIVVGSVTLITINKKEFTGLNYQDYCRYLEDNPTGEERYFSFRKRFIFINNNATTTGNEIVIYGKLKAPHPSADDDTMPFSPDTDNQEMSGNDAIVNIAFAEILESEKKKNPAKAKSVRVEAYRILLEVYQPMADGKALRQNLNRPLLDVGDLFSGQLGDSSSPSFEAGNFNI